MSRIDDWLLTALQRHKADRLDEAVPFYRKVLEAAPGHADALYMLGTLYVQRGEFEAAAELLEKAVAAQPDNAGARNNLTIALGALGRPDAPPQSPSPNSGGSAPPGPQSRGSAPMPHSPLPAPHSPQNEGTEAERRKQVIARQETDIARWSDPVRLEAAWDARARQAADFLPAGAVVLDMGCGAMALERFLPEGCGYRPCDVTARDARTHVCDFNQGEFPEPGDATHITLLGVLEYVYDVPGFLNRLRRYNLPVILSYCPTDLTAHLDRGALGWVNRMSLEGLARALNEAGFFIQTDAQIDANQILARATPAPVQAASPRKVLALSYNNVGNFGDRLGYHLLNDVLPPEAEVHYAHFHPWDVPDEDFDLLILGIGNSLFGPLLSDDLLELVRRTPHTVGIFGTQYRHTIEPKRFGALLDRLDLWFARYEEDILLYGRRRHNVLHLGDWLVNAFPLTEGRDPETLAIGQEIWQDLPLDRTIQKIQAHRRVFSTRLHPLLCALASAQEAAYREQREDGGGQPSGKFRSLFLDVFGRTFPEEEFFAVDRAAVIAYKTRVRQATEVLRVRLADLLASAPQAVRARAA